MVRSRDTGLLSQLTSLAFRVFSSHVTHMQSLVTQLPVDPINERGSHLATGIWISENSGKEERRWGERAEKSHIAKLFGI